MVKTTLVQTASVHQRHFCHPHVAIYAGYLMVAGHWVTGMEENQSFACNISRMPLERWRSFFFVFK